MAKDAWQLAPQLMPAGELVTVPKPDFITARAVGMAMKVAVMVLFAVMVRTQAFPELESQPVQKAKLEPEEGTAMMVRAILYE